MKLFFSVMFFFLSLNVNAKSIDWPSKNPPKDPIQYFSQLRQQFGSSWEKDFGVLATLDHEHQPQQRLMRIYSFTRDGIIFHTHAHTNKALEFNKNPNVSFLIFWRVGHEVIQAEVSGKVHLLRKGNPDAPKSELDEDYNQYVIQPTSIKFTLSDSFRKKDRVTHQSIIYRLKHETWTASQTTYSIPQAK